MNIFTRIWSFIESKNPNIIWLKILLVLSAVLLFMWWKRRYMPNTNSEGFSQNEKYVVKRNGDIYDSFYIGIYDHLNKTKSRSRYEMHQIIETTQPDKENSIILDIGCGTGCIVNELTLSGYRAFGVDKSAAMVDISKRKYPNTKIKHGNAEDSMEFERETFTHILCLNKTIYEFPDKVAFFRNCYHWLIPGGYLIVHMVNPAKFNPVTPAGIPSMIDNPQKYTKDRITDTVIDFMDFKYKSTYDFTNLQPNGIVRHTETFTDKQSGNIRENEHIIKMDTEKSILEAARMCQFVAYGQFSMNPYNGDDHQTVYIFEKI
jgi:SAM-dependent methyltransferase